MIKRVLRVILNFANVRLNYPRISNGRYLLILRDEKLAKSQIPDSVTFNTMSGNISVGRNTVFGEGVQVLTGKHLTIFDIDTDINRLHEVPDGGRDISIGDNCYIGGNAIIIGPLRIGDFAVIGAGAVVTKDVPEKCFVAGNPARIIKQITNEEQS